MSVLMPAEWEPHRATWIAWPHAEDDWPDKFATIDWVYAEIVRLLAKSEQVEIICRDHEQLERVQFCLAQHHVAQNFNLHILDTDRSWLRDSAPTAIKDGSQTKWVKWQFNAWAKYDNYHLDEKVPELVGRVSKHTSIQAVRDDNNQPFVLEGGAIDTDGQGTLLVTEECLQSEIQCRNPGFSKEDYERHFEKYLGISKTIWLVGGCEGDDTHGHIDDVARFVPGNKVLLAYEENPEEEFHAVSKQNEEILKNSKNALRESLQVIRLPMPEPMYFGEERLPASYANFYVGNKVVIVPTFNDKNDRIALSLIADCFPDRETVGISAVDLVLGFGTLHCLTQQEPV